MAIFSPCSSVPVTKMTFSPNNLCSKQHKIKKMLQNIKKHNLGDQIIETDMKSGNGVGSNSGVSTSHVGRAVGIIKRSSDHESFFLFYFSLPKTTRCQNKNPPTPAPKMAISYIRASIFISLYPRSDGGNEG